MSKITTEATLDTEDANLTAALEQAIVHEQDMQTIYTLRVNMARARTAKVKILRGQLETLDESYAANRARADRALMKPETLDVILYTSDEIVERENLPAYACGPLPDAKRALRKVFLHHLLQNQEKIMVDFRIAISIAGRALVSYGNLARYIFDKHLTATISELSRKDADNLSRHLDKSKGEADDLMTVALHYPILERQTVDIYEKDQVETFYGHLLASISGMNRQLYESYQYRHKAIGRELAEYAPELSGLPTLDNLGAMGDQMRIHLLRKIFHDSIEHEIADTQASHGVNYPRALLEHYQDFGRATENKELIDEFEALPEISILMEGANRVFNKNTRRKMVEQLSKREIAPWLLEMTYHLMCAIYDLDQLGKDGNEEATAMSQQFGAELMSTFQKAAQIKKPADPSIIEGLFHEMTNMTQLARYCYEELRKA